MLLRDIYTTNRHLKANFTSALRGGEKGERMKNYNRRYEIEIFNVQEISELHNQHFAIYNPNHKEKDSWFWEYSNLQEALADGITVDELEKAINSGYVRIVVEVEPWD